MELKNSFLSTYQISSLSISVLMLFMGGMLYLLFRDNSLLMFEWVRSVGLENSLNYARENTSWLFISDWVKYSLPDGLWCASYILLMASIWSNKKFLIRFIWTISLPCIAVITELLQLFGNMIGTYDTFDLICYIIPILIYIGYEYIKR